MDKPCGAIRKRLKSQRLAPKVGRNQTPKSTVRFGRHLETFQAIKDYVDGNDQVSISQLCRFLKVSRLGYYKWLKHEETASETTNQALMATIKELHAKYKGILGYRRMIRFVNRQLGTNYNKKRIRRSRAYCTESSLVNIEENLLNRDFIADAPNQKWCTDVTFFHYSLGSKAYLSAIKALYDGSIVAYHISHHKDNSLVMENLRQAMAANPGARPLLHSDRGSQYTSKEYRLVTTQLQLTRSMSRVGKCIDNAPIESFFGHFKIECYDLKTYKTFEELVEDIDAYLFLQS